MASAAPFSASRLHWREFGRAWGDGDPPAWTTWVAPLGGGRHALYRSLVVEGGTVAVTVELDPRHPSGVRVLHRDRCPMPEDPRELGVRVRALLAQADAAAACAAAAALAGGAAARRRSPRPAAAAGMEAVEDPDRRVRERAYLLWEREGRPEGRAEEFWARACREEARATG
jgi:hypothetical protein